MKTYEDLTPLEREELEELSLRVRKIGSEEQKRYEHLLSKARYFAEGDYDYEEEQL